MTRKKSRPNSGTEQGTWVKGDYKAQRIIATSISPKLTTHLLNCKTSKEMWDKLHIVFEQKSETNVLFLLQKFYSFNKEPHDSIWIQVVLII